MAQSEYARGYQDALRDCLAALEGRTVPGQDGAEAVRTWLELNLAGDAR